MLKIVEISREQILWRLYVRAFERHAAAPNPENATRMNESYRRWCECFLRDAA